MRPAWSIAIAHRGLIPRKSNWSVRPPRWAVQFYSETPTDPSAQKASLPVPPAGTAIPDAADTQLKGKSKPQNDPSRQAVPRSGVETKPDDVDDVKKYPQIVRDTVRQVLLQKGLKFEPPMIPNPPPKSIHHRKRYEPLLDQFTRAIMRDGKLSKAQRHMSMVLKFLRTSPVPRTDPSKPLAPGSPPAAQLPLNPLEYLRVAIDSVAPLIKLRSLKGMAGGGASLDVPMPLSIRQRRRAAIQWVLSVVKKRESGLSGREMFAHRLASELIAIVQGTSSVWNQRQAVHKQGTIARANLNAPQLRKKGMKKKTY